ncbi:hypothetical protein HK097_009916 [Rhizophlyctis rosea]|uniref:Uncharacterized protein n=1 Tax=Rhizophlyctis rosea TaxID=64517 RepID=A0AAD5SK54_9FUNG|nr:hypothetical protein HK097_009916 [Rhizophlyctis rosea]
MSMKANDSFFSEYAEACGLLLSKRNYVKVPAVESSSYATPTAAATYETPVVPHVVEYGPTTKATSTRTPVPSPYSKPQKGGAEYTPGSQSGGSDTAVHSGNGQIGGKNQGSTDGGEFGGVDNSSGEQPGFAGSNSEGNGGADGGAHGGADGGSNGDNAGEEQSTAATETAGTTSSAATDNPSVPASDLSAGSNQPSGAPTPTGLFNAGEINAANEAGSSGLNQKAATGVGISVAVVGVAALVVAGLILRRRRQSSVAQHSTPPTKYYGFDDHSNASGGYSKYPNSHPECKPNYPDISYTNPRSVHSERSVTPVRPAPTPQPLPSLSRSSFLSLSSLPAFAGGHGAGGGTVERDFNHQFSYANTPPQHAVYAASPSPMPSVTPVPVALPAMTTREVEEPFYDIAMDDVAEPVVYQTREQNVDAWTKAAGSHQSLQSLEDLATGSVIARDVEEVRQEYKVIDASAVPAQTMETAQYNSHLSVYTDGYDVRDSFISDYRDSMISDGYNNRDSVMTSDTNYRDSVMTTATDATFDNDVLAAHFAHSDNMQSSILNALNHMGANVEGEAKCADVPAPSVAESSEVDDGTLARRV